MHAPQEAVRGSASWAAWGDALGFITELTDAAGVRRRAGTDTVITTVPWKRKIGGQFGVTADLPAGAYSDDTQLRLATCRAIRSDGRFDVDSFAKVELTSWLAYPLGAGRGSKAAAHAMTRLDAKWASNIFAAGEIRYVDIGGNGAAMRIQPHVWSARDLTDTAAISHAVLRNAVVTHGHPRGFLGAILHARSLARALADGSAVAPLEWLELAEGLRDVATLVDADEDLARMWRPSWERAAQGPLHSAITETVEEIVALARSAAKAADEGADRAQAYADWLTAAGGMDDRTRGSATVTATAATLLAYLFRDKPRDAITCAVNLLGSDTDTIATMTGALVGAVLREPQPGELQDANLIDIEARRLARLAAGERTGAFRYPDPLKYSPPKTGLDLVGAVDDGLALSGLGTLSGLGREYKTAGKTPSVYQWGALHPGGQQIFLRRRLHPRKLPASALPTKPVAGPVDQPAVGKRGSDSRQQPQEALFDSPVNNSGLGTSNATNDESKLVPVAVAFKTVVESAFDERTVGRMLLEQASARFYGVERAAALAGLISARLAEQHSQNRER